LNAAIPKVYPKYPSAARAAHVKGNIKVEIIVDRSGNVVEACVSQGHPLLRAAAKDAALQWKFKNNFGLSKKSKIKAHYIQSFLVFHFRLE
jgi:TonB family protein